MPGAARGYLVSNYQTQAITSAGSPVPLPPGRARAAAQAETKQVLGLCIYGAQAGQPGLARSPLFTNTGDGDTIRPGHVANDYNPPVPSQADPAPRPDGEDVTLDPDL